MSTDFWYQKGGSEGDCRTMPVDSQDLRRFALIPALLLVTMLGTAQTREWSDEEILSRSVNPSREQQFEPWPAHQIVGNIYYVGTRNLGSFLVVTDEGHVLINTSYEETLPLLRESIESLGFRVEDIRIILGSQAHPDHMTGNALMKDWTGAEVMVMEEDIPLLRQTAGADTPIDRVLNDSDAVTLGGMTLTARLTPGHTPGTTAWLMTATEDGRDYEVVILGGGVTGRQQLAGDEELQAQFEQTFEVHRSLECDVPLGPHTPMYRMEEKFAQLGNGPNPFIDPEICQEEIWLMERAYALRLEEQLKALGN
jgi:metallo-beta-lactamase class B